MWLDWDFIHTEKFYLVHIELQFIHTWVENIVETSNCWIDDFTKKIHFTTMYKVFHLKISNGTLSIFWFGHTALNKWYAFSMWWISSWKTFTFRSIHALIFLRGATYYHKSSQKKVEMKLQIIKDCRYNNLIIFPSVPYFAIHNKTSFIQKSV